MNFSKPHWLTAVAGTLGAICGTLIASNAVPQYQAYLGALAAICAALATPTISASGGGGTTPSTGAIK